ncbi:MAG: SOS response-associated peptidase [Xanthomonadales bacterium]|nr:SOS response-associated peptidase [Xanthomonadales bacterium]
MCGRYYLDTLPETLSEEFSVQETPDLTASYNIAPTQLAPIVAVKEGARRMGHARWGLIPFWAKDEKIGSRMINARSETAASKPAFRQAFHRRRCLVPASGFFEWKKMPDKRQPYAIAPLDRPLFAFAGLWERWKNPADETVISFTILTRQASSRIANLHDRMPVMVPRELMDQWLDPEGPADEILFTGQDTGDVKVYPVSTAVNSPRNNRPELLEPIELEDP